MRIFSSSLNINNFTDVTRPNRNFSTEYIQELLNLVPGLNKNNESTFASVTVPSATVDPTGIQILVDISTYGYSGNSFPSPYDVYLRFKALCYPCARNESCNDCVKGAFNNYAGVQWMTYTTSILMKCCDGSFSYDRTTCPVCGAKNYLPLILGLTLTFVGLVMLCVAVKIWLKNKDKKKRAAADKEDFSHGRGAPPSFVVPSGGGKNKHATKAGGSKDTVIDMPEAPKKKITDDGPLFVRAQNAMHQSEPITAAPAAAAATHTSNGSGGMIHPSLHQHHSNEKKHRKEEEPALIGAPEKKEKKSKDKEKDKEKRNS